MLHRILFAIATTFAAATFAAAAEPEIYTTDLPGVGAGGYDVVSYLSGGPLPGKPEIAAQWKGAEWYFAAPENRAAFQAEPEKYAPRYGGYCAFAVAKGATARGDPLVWTVVEDRLYFNLSAGVQQQWRADIPGNISAANANWPAVLQ
jgi:YHS domain-containing protein